MEAMLEKPTQVTRVTLEKGQVLKVPANCWVFETKTKKLLLGLTEILASEASEYVIVPKVAGG